MAKKDKKEATVSALKYSALWGVLLFWILLVVDMVTKVMADAYFSQVDAPNKIDIIKGWLALTITYNDGIAVRAFWDRKKKTLHFWMPHTALQEIDFQLNEAVGFLSLNDNEGALPKFEILIGLTYSLPQSCNFDFKNIF